MSKSMPYRFYSYKIKDLTALGKLFFIKRKREYLRQQSSKDIPTFLFNIKCRIACDDILKELENDNSTSNRF